jgi:hypothetical protein
VRRSLIFALVCLSPCFAAREAGYVGSEACARCHKQIYEKYRITAMARSSGRTVQGPKIEMFVRPTFTHAASGYRYDVANSGDGLRFAFVSAKTQFHGAKALPFFVGSGATARSYLIADDGYLFEAPVAYYAAERRWGLAPRYDSYTHPFLTRPVVAGCLGCHASFVNVASGTQNRYAEPPFEEGGIACERCHGPGAEHAAGRGLIVNPVKLPTDRRDGVCSQCHLSGEVRVRVAGSGWDAYRPGARLSDSVKVFVRSGKQAGMTVTGHVEKLAQSACKKAAGDRLWCGSCHDPHSDPDATNRAAYFRRRCLACHQANACRESSPARRARADDCTACHMSKSPVRDAQHVVYTDHSIPRRPRGRTPAVAGDLVPFEGFVTSDRDLALAYAIAGDRGRALPLLRQAAIDHPDDVEVLTYLAEIYRNNNRPNDAIPLYRRALELDKEQVMASVGLGGILMERSDFQGAIRLWEDALGRNAGLVLVRTNLAMAYWRIGDMRMAEQHLRRTLELSPAFEPAVKLLSSMRKK